MNTSFSKYVKQCKWGLSLDTAGSDYSAHQLARLLTTILGRLPGPRARRWEESPVPPRSSRTRAPGIPAGGDWRASAGGWGAGGWEGPLTLYFPPREDIPGRVAVVEAGRRTQHTSTPAPTPGIGTPVKVSPLWGNNLNSGQTPRQGLKSYDFLGDEAEAWGKRQEAHDFPEGVEEDGVWLTPAEDTNLCNANPRAARCAALSPRLPDPVSLELKSVCIIRPTRCTP